MKTMNNLNKTKIFFLVIAAITITSCNNDDEPVNEEEVITTVTTTLTGGGQVITLTSKDLDGVDGPNAPEFTATRDLDGDGPNAPVIIPSGNLAANTIYSGAVTFLNETQSPAEDITVEVEEEGVDHQVFYQLSAGLGTITYTDTDLDLNGKPIGLTFTLTTGNAGTGNLTATLRHLPNKSGLGVASGDITNAGGSTDAEVTYPVWVN
jgi:hypothetical protein